MLETVVLMLTIPLIRTRSDAYCFLDKVVYHGVPCFKPYTWIHALESLEVPFTEFLPSDSPGFLFTRFGFHNSQFR